MTCLWSEPVLLDDDDGPALQCRRYPPVVLVDGDDVIQCRPQMSDTDWCGEWADSGDVAASGPQQADSDDGAPKPENAT